MTTKKIFAAALAALFMTAFNACTKEETPAAPEVPGTDETLVEMTFTAVQAAGESATWPDAEPAQAAVKSTFDGTQIGWETDDLVAIYDGTAKRQFTVESVENGVATLKGMVSPDAKEFYAVFPYSAAGDALPTQEGQISLNLPAVQTLAEGKNFDEDAFVTVGKVEDGNVVLKNAVSVIKLNIPEGVSSVRLQGFAYDNISGGVYASSDAVAGEGEVSSITLKPSDASFVAGEHYIALLPTRFTAGFKVIYSKEGAMAVVKTTSPVDFPIKGGFDITASTVDLTWLANPIMTETDLRAYFANQDDYAGETAKLGQDITLTSAWTPVTLTGIFDGQNHTISGVNVSAKGNVGFFSKVQSGASVKNLTIEGTINAINPSSEAKSYVGFAGLVSGTVRNCINKANITLAADVQWQALVGGIAGNVLSGGTLHGCTNKGNITTTGTAGTQSWFIGGIAGYIGDPSGAGWTNNNAGGTLTSCINEGALNIDNAYVESIGGVVGMFRGGSLTGCESNGSFVIGATKADSRLGGIAGYIQNRSGKKLTMSGCTNNATINLTSAATTLSSIGGIVGMAHHQEFETEVSGCYNKGQISVSSTGNINVGGVVATYGASQTAPFRFYDCHNQAPVSCVNLESTTAFLDVTTYIGGVAGATGMVTKFESCSNSGAISSNRLSKNYVGGIVGYSNGTTTVSSSTNSGAVTANPSKSVVTADYVGGIVGYTTGTMTMTGNTNSATGTVSIVAQSSDGYRSAAGGVIGFTDAASHTLTGNINRANVLTDCPNKYTPAGGVVGLVRGNMVSSQNINFGNVAAVSTQTSDVFAGGIVGIFDMKGTSGATTNKTASLTADKSFGAVSSPARSGLLFSIYAWDCYGNVNITDCVVGGSRQQGTGAATEITATNFASHLWSWVRSGAVNDTLIQKNTTFGKAADYSTAGLEEGTYNTTKW